MYSKWEWIEKQLREIGEDELADMAAEIEGALGSIYGNTITEEWKEDNEDTILSLDDDDKHGILSGVNAISGEMSYCIACEETEEICDDCKYAAEYGKCKYNTSQYGRFRVKMGQKLGLR